MPLLLLATYTNIGKELTHSYVQTSVCLRILAFIGIIRICNGALNRRSLNNWNTHTWDWSKELVVVTGGSDGFGKHITFLLAARSIKVIILDIQPPTYPLRTYLQTPKPPPHLHPQLTHPHRSPHRPLPPLRPDLSTRHRPNRPNDPLHPRPSDNPDQQRRHGHRRLHPLHP